MVLSLCCVSYPATSCGKTAHTVRPSCRSGRGSTSLAINLATICPPKTPTQCNFEVEEPVFFPGRCFAPFPPSASLPFSSTERRGEKAPLCHSAYHIDQGAFAPVLQVACPIRPGSDVACPAPRNAGGARVLSGQNGSASPLLLFFCLWEFCELPTSESFPVVLGARSLFIQCARRLVDCLSLSTPLYPHSFTKQLRPGPGRWQRLVFFVPCGRLSPLPDASAHISVRSERLVFFSILTLLEVSQPHCGCGQFPVTLFFLFEALDFMSRPLGADFIHDTISPTTSSDRW
ncbi:hypothetical protein VFPPC_17795 [Pochonia chlamydosporia 170]|uniref:Uncharacterized protein n=1 Tax=Pochonia chlamydosporia 170 TaxID=1380566 RepID=A0A219AQX9_METCM|nr:hypothetical protein VFPPC_17795 [Pochonia chlamydosporia 170]OWT43012.1 hypothetical protein VFPPC_17795 [Pochonia chlamydosporia 170]